MPKSKEAPTKVCIAGIVMISDIRLTTSAARTASGILAQSLQSRPWLAHLPHWGVTQRLDIAFKGP